MTLKMIDVDEKKWRKFRVYCVNHGVTMKAEMDRFLNRFEKEGG